MDRLWRSNSHRGKMFGLFFPYHPLPHFNFFFARNFPRLRMVGVFVWRAGLAAAKFFSKFDRGMFAPSHRKPYRDTNADPICWRPPHCCPYFACFLRHAHFPAGITTSLYPSRIHQWSEASVLEHGNPTKASESAASKFQGQLIQKLYYMLFPVLQAYAQPLPFKRYGMQWKMVWLVYIHWKQKSEASLLHVFAICPCKCDFAAAYIQYVCHFSIFSKWMRCRNGESRQCWLRDVCVLCFVSCLKGKSTPRLILKNYVCSSAVMVRFVSFVAGNRSSLLCENFDNN